MIDVKLLNKDKLKTGDIILQKTFFSILKPVTRFSLMIRLLTKSDINHTSEVVILGNKAFIIHALGGGITIESFEKWKQKKYTRKVIVMRNEYKEFGETHQAKLLSQIHVKYDRIGIINIFISILTGNRKRIDSKKSSKARWCSEFSARSHDIDERETFLPRDFLTNRFFIEVDVLKK